MTSAVIWSSITNKCLNSIPFTENGPLKNPGQKSACHLPLPISEHTIFLKFLVFGFLQREIWDHTLPQGLSKRTLKCHSCNTAKITRNIVNSWTWYQALTFLLTVNPPSCTSLSIVASHSIVVGRDWSFLSTALSKISNSSQECGLIIWNP